MRHSTPSRVLGTLAATVLATGLCVPLVKAQAAAEYTLGVSKSAAGAAGMGNMGQSLSKAVNQLSDKLKTQTHESPSPMQKKKDNRAASASKTGEGGGTLHFTSKPGNGKPAMKITRSDRDQSSEQAAVAKGQTVDNHANSANQYPSVITLDFKDTKE